MENFETEIRESEGTETFDQNMDALREQERGIRGKVPKRFTGLINALMAGVLSLPFIAGCGKSELPPPSGAPEARKVETAPPPKKTEPKSQAGPESFNDFLERYNERALGPKENKKSGNIEDSKENRAESVEELTKRIEKLEAEFFKKKDEELARLLPLIIGPYPVRISEGDLKVNYRMGKNIEEVHLNPNETRGIFNLYEKYADNLGKNKKTPKILAGLRKARAAHILGLDRPKDGNFDEFEQKELEEKNRGLRELFPRYEVNISLKTLYRVLGLESMYAQFGKELPENLKKNKEVIEILNEKRINEVGKCIGIP